MYIMKHRIKSTQCNMVANNIQKVNLSFVKCYTINPKKIFWCTFWNCSENFNPLLKLNGMGQMLHKLKNKTRIEVNI